MNGFFIVERDDDKIWRNLDEEERLPMLAYRGFDGSNLHSDEGTLFDKVTRVLMKSDLLSLKTNNRIDVIFVNEDIDKKEDFDFLGYDIGIINLDNDIIFSSVINEIRKGGNIHVEKFTLGLNENYLFKSIDDARGFLASREKAFSLEEVDYLETAFETNELLVFALYIIKSYNENYNFDFKNTVYF